MGHAGQTLSSNYGLFSFVYPCFYLRVSLYLIGLLYGRTLKKDTNYKRKILESVDCHRVINLIALSSRCTRPISSSYYQIAGVCYILSRVIVPGSRRACTYLFIQILFNPQYIIRLKSEVESKMLIVPEKTRAMERPNLLLSIKIHD